jgi:hypothetical protein
MQQKPWREKRKGKYKGAAPHVHRALLLVMAAAPPPAGAPAHPGAATAIPSLPPPPALVAARVPQIPPSVSVPVGGIVNADTVTNEYNYVKAIKKYKALPRAFSVYFHIHAVLAQKYSYF